MTDPQLSPEIEDFLKSVEGFIPADIPTPMSDLELLKAILPIVEVAPELYDEVEARYILWTEMLALFAKSLDMAPTLALWLMADRQVGEKMVETILKLAATAFAQGVLYEREKR